MNFHVGQKVVCVDDTFTHTPLYIGTQRPTAGATYTIRYVGASAQPSRDGVVVLLEEIVNPIRHYGNGPYEPGWHRGRFRPLVITNIDVFTKMLAPTPKEKVLQPSE